MSETTFLIAVLLKILKILIYFFFQVLFLRRLTHKWRQGEPIILEFSTFSFFFCMMLGSIAEILWMTYTPTFYDPVGASYIYFIGFIALTFLSIGIERSVNLPTKGLIALIPLGMAIATRFIDITAPPYIFIAFVVVIIPGLFLYQAYKTEGVIRRQFLFIGIGYFLIFAGEAINYNIILKHFYPLHEFWIGLTGDSGEYLPPLLILFGLLCLVNGYVRLAKKLEF